MTLLLNWIQTPVARALGWTLFHFLWEGLAIAALLAVGLFFLRSSRARYAAGCGALAVMLLAGVATFVRVLPEQSRLHGPIALQLSSTTPNDAGQSATHGWRLDPAGLLPWTVPIWLAGVLMLHLRTIAGWMKARRLCHSGVCRAPQVWQERLTKLAAGVRLSVPLLLLESCRVDVPVVVGYFRPVILIPLGLATGMPPDYLEAILLHELAHIRRRDYLVNLLQAVAENLLFYHPAVWWVSGVIRTERENSCDDLVVAVRGSARDYAVALTALEESRIGEPVLAANGGNLMKRIQRLLNRPEPPRTALTAAFSGGLILVTAAVALYAWQPKPAEPAPQPTGSAYDNWVNQDVLYIITPQERDAFLQLATDQQREHFIENFWLRRDPTPGTATNEFKDEHYRRIAYTNDHFTAPSGMAGWKTDRGRIYITSGPPDRIESLKNDPSVLYPVERWNYRHIEGMGDDITFHFTDPSKTGDYRLEKDASAERVVDGSVVLKEAWPDTVKRGDMRREVRGLGVLGENGLAEVKVAETQMKDVVVGQASTIDLRLKTLARGRVARIAPTAENGTVTVTVQLDGPPPTGAKAGMALDATIDIELMKDVIYVGRPVFGQANTDSMLFKIEPDGQHASRVPVRFGRTSVNTIEIVSGLAPGDQVILSDMSKYAKYDRLQVK